MTKYNPEAYLPMVGPLTEFEDDFRWDQDIARVDGPADKFWPCPECKVMPHVGMFQKYDAKLDKHFEFYRYFCPNCGMRDVVGYWTVECLGARLGWQFECMRSKRMLDKRNDFQYNQSVNNRGG